jgi:mannosylglycerate hydrolase
VGPSILNPQSSILNPLTFHLIPHTHWDREWYLPHAAFQARLVPVLDGVLDQLEQDPAARFLLDGQTVLLEDYLAVKPENEPRIAALVQRGALEIGPWYVLSDLLIPSAESLRRNLAEGTRDSARFGKRLDVLYSPDAFGHPGELPRLAAEFGIRRAVVRRGLGRPKGGDRDLYRWEAAGDESVLLYHLPAGGYDVAIELAGAGKRLAQRWAPIRRDLVGRAATDQIAVFLGADHHAMVPDVSRLCARLQALEPGHAVRISGLTEYFEAVERSQPDPPTIHGELRRTDGHSWVLQDVHSTRSRMKRRHSSAELMLARIAEPLARLADASAGGGEDRAGLLRAAWRTLLQCQFHDTLAGTACDAVEREQQFRLESLEALSREIATQSLWKLVGHDPDHRPASRLILWNPADRPRAGIITAELTFFRRDVLVGRPEGRVPREGQGYQPFDLETLSGERVPVQVLAVRGDQERLDASRHYPDQDEVDRVWVAFRAPAIPALGTSALRPRPRERTADAEGLRVGEGLLANRFIRIGVSHTGVLTLTDQRSAQQYRGLAELSIEPDHGDLYTFSPAPGNAAVRSRPGMQAVIAHGPLLGATETRWNVECPPSGQIALRQIVAVHADSPIVRLRLDLENSAVDYRLRLRFPVGISGVAVAGSAFGVERRSPVTAAGLRDPLELPVRTAPAHRFVAAAAGARGLAVFAPGCFEYGWGDDGVLSITLLRAVGELSRGDLPERPGHAGWPMSTPLAQEQGRHTVELAVLPIEAATLAEPDRLEQLWEDRFLPVQAFYLRDNLSQRDER